LILIAWQLTNGFFDKFRSNETSFQLQFPVWWAYGLSMVGAYMAAFVSVMMAYFRSREYFLQEKIFINMDGDEK
jgi:hypothetical protein